MKIHTHTHTLERELQIVNGLWIKGKFILVQNCLKSIHTGGHKIMKIVYYENLCMDSNILNKINWYDSIFPKKFLKQPWIYINSTDDLEIVVL